MVSIRGVINSQFSSFISNKGSVLAWSTAFRNGSFTFSLTILVYFIHIGTLNRSKGPVIIYRLGGEVGGKEDLGLNNVKFSRFPL